MTTHYESDEAIDALVRDFLDRALPKERWTHAAHFATALWMIRHRGLDAAARDMPWMIRAYNESVGGVNSDTSGYHETITQASLRMAARLLVDRGGEPLHLALDALMMSPLGRSDWPLAHWTKDRLMAAEARRHWMEPDLAPLPS